MSTENEFQAHGTYCISNSGGYLVEVSTSGDAARTKEAWGGDNPKVSDWLEIEYVVDEDGNEEPVIDPNGVNIPLNLVMRLAKKVGQ